MPTARPIDPVTLPFRARLTPVAVLALCLLVFYIPMWLSAGSVLTSRENDPIAHMLISLGDPRPGGRFFHYMDLSANARLWGQDVKYHPLHFVRLLSIALGANQPGWAALLIAVHSALFLVIYWYSRQLCRASPEAALAGASVAFFTVAWLEWIALVYWTAGAVLLVISIGEYGLFVRTGRRRHLALCGVANACQPYVAQAQALIPTQLYLLGAVLLMAAARAPAWRRTVWPLIRWIWPLTALGWMPILAPMVYAVGSGLTTREALKPLTWRWDGAVVTSWLGVLVPAPSFLGDLVTKLGWSGSVTPPNSFLFGSFLFLPALLALWASRRRSLRLMVFGVLLYFASVLTADAFVVPSAMVRSLGMSRVFAFPALSGVVVAAAIGLPGFPRSEGSGTRILHGVYAAMLGAALIGVVALMALNADMLTTLASRWGLLGSGTGIPAFLRASRVLMAGIALGLTGYAWYRRSASRAESRDASRHRWLALSLTIAAPALGFGYGEGWYERPPELEAVLSPPAEFRVLRELIPNAAYRVGVVLASEMHLAEGDWDGFWARTSQPDTLVLYQLRENDVRLRQGLAFVLPALHFLAPVHAQLRREGNPFLQRWERPEAAVLNRRNVIIRPDAESFEEYGVRYWLSDFNLERYRPGKFVRVYQGERAAVFENREAKPVAYFLQQPHRALSLHHVPYGVAVTVPEGAGGELSLHLDLRRMQARAVGPDGRTVPLPLRPAGLRWEVRVPSGSAAVVFIANEAGWLACLAMGGLAAFLILLALLVA